LDFYESHLHADAFELKDLAELIFQSAQDALNAGGLEPGLRSRLVDFVAEHQHDFPDTLAYSADLEQDDWQFPILIQEARFDQDVQGLQ
jgi:hypothetical protein